VHSRPARRAPACRARRTVVRSGRRFVLCGLHSHGAARAGDALLRAASADASLGVWLPGVSFALVLLFSAYVLGRPAPFPLTADTMLARDGTPHFSIADFASAAR